MIAESELMPCPFCGGESVPAMAMNMQGTRYYRQCNNCNMQGPDASTKEDRDAAWNRRPASPPAARGVEGSWRCFHCGETFTDVKCAQDHFGGDLLALAACQIKAEEGGLVELIRKQEAELDRHRSEDTASYREFYSLGADHTTKLRQAEEDGYAKGLADGRAEQQAALPPVPAARGVEQVSWQEEVRLALCKWWGMSLVIHSAVRRADPAWLDDVTEAVKLTQTLVKAGKLEQAALSPVPADAETVRLAEADVERVRMAIMDCEAAGNITGSAARVVAQAAIDAMQFTQEVNEIPMKVAIDIIKRWAIHTADSDEGIYVGGNMEELACSITAAFRRHAGASHAAHPLTAAMPTGEE